MWCGTVCCFGICCRSKAGEAEVQQRNQESTDIEKVFWKGEWLWLLVKRRPNYTIWVSWLLMLARRSMPLSMGLRKRSNLRRNTRDVTFVSFGNINTLHGAHMLSFSAGF